MTAKSELTKESLAELLSWLASKPEQAEQKYKTLHQGLTKVLAHWGCSDAEALADETINRVAARVPEIKQTYKGNPDRYFFGVAKKVFQEYKRNAQKFVVLPENSPAIADPEPTDEVANKCFKSCLEKLTPQQRELVGRYYSERTPAQRERLARDLGISVRTLRVRMFRIVKDLRICARKCIERGNPEMK